MSLLDSQGRPTAKSKLSDEVITQALLGMRNQLQSLNQQQMQLGLYIEFLTEAIMAAVDTEGNQLIHIDPNDFPTFAEKRITSIREEALAAMTAQAVEQSSTQSNELADLTGVNLDDN